MKILGILLCIVGLVVAIIGLVGQISGKKRLEQLSGAGKQKLGELIPVLQETKDSLSDIGDDGAIKENVTVMGQPQVQQPLVSPIGGVPCIYYKYKVTVCRTEYYMETETDANGNQRQVQKSRRHEDTLDHGESAVPSFTINDGTGSIVVEPQNGSFEGLIKTVDKSERNYNSMMNNGMLNLGRLSLNLGGMMNNGMMNNGMQQNNVMNAVAGAVAGAAIATGMAGNNMMGMGGNMPELIKYTEEIIGLDRNITVVGTVCDSMGEFRLRNAGKSKVIISTKSADDMLAETKKSVKTKGFMLIGGGVGLVIGIVLAILGGGNSDAAKDQAPANANAPAQEAPAQK